MTGFPADRQASASAACRRADMKGAGSHVRERPLTLAGTPGSPLAALLRAHRAQRVVQQRRERVGVLGQKVGHHRDEVLAIERPDPGNPQLGWPTRGDWFLASAMFPRYPLPASSSSAATWGWNWYASGTGRTPAPEIPK